ncbi:MAG: hypothetical protein KY459_08745 [Acidobacteria bacterium]|nr:hypothetical protein [Acidobacteriota bacterium]
MHIPKTAGTTFLSILGRQYHRARTFDLSGNVAADAARLESMRAAERKAIRLFTGHAPIETGLPGPDAASIITFLRDPIARVRSFCQHVAEGKSAYLLRDFPPESFDLDRFLSGSGGELSNLQTKMLINRGSITASERLDRMKASEARERALENLFGRVAAFGLQEKFDQSVLMFSELFSWSLPLYYSRNESTFRPGFELDARHRDRIAELNAIDIEVYEAARRAFDDQLSRRVREGETARFRLINRISSGPMRTWAFGRDVGLYWYRKLLRPAEFRALTDSGAPTRRS